MSDPLARSQIRNLLAIAWQFADNLLAMGQQPHVTFHVIVLPRLVPARRFSSFTKQNLCFCQRPPIEGSQNKVLSDTGNFERYPDGTKENGQVVSEAGHIIIH
jgi:hypothetical protein